MSTREVVRGIKGLPHFFQGVIVGSIILVVAFTIAILFHGISEIQAEAQGLGASFNWSGKGNSTTLAHLTNTSYTGANPASAVYAVYWCTRAGIDGCAPDFSDNNKASETLTFQTISLSVPQKGKSSDIVMPGVGALGSKTCGRFQVDLGLANNGGIIGGSVFSLGSNCEVSPTPLPQASVLASPVAACPYQSTQAQVQNNVTDPWGDSKSIILGQSVRFGGFHNGTGRFAGDPVNSYSPNVANVDFFITDPGGASSTTLTAPYPITFTPTKIGTYSFTGKTRKNSGNPGAGYFAESSCIDGGTVTVVGPVVSPTPKPSVTPSSSPVVSPLPTVSPSTQPGRVQLKLCKFQDDNADGIVNSGEHTISWNFTVQANGEASKTVESHWWNVLTQGCVVTDVPINQIVTVNEENRSGWRLTALYADGIKTDNSNFQYTSNVDQVKVLWFLNTFTPIGGPATNATPFPSESPTPTPGTNIQPECMSLSANPTFGGAPLGVNFIAHGRDSDGIVNQMEFTFGDGASGTTISTNGGTNSDTTGTTSHTYQTAGTYFATLRVKDNSGQSSEWSSTPDSCRVKIEVTGQVLGTQTQISPPTALPKAGADSLFLLSYITSAFGGVSLKFLSRKIRSL